MTRFALIAFYRSLARHKLHAVLNIGGLAVGLAVFIVLSLYVRFETSFETWLPHHDQIYVVQSLFVSDATDHPTPHSLGTLADYIRQDFPGVRGVRDRQTSATILRGGTSAREQIDQVDPDFFAMFDLPVVRGDARSALADPSNLIMTTTMAQRYFGAANPIGQTLTVSFLGQQHLYRVAAIIADLPKNSDLRFDLLVRLVPPPVPPTGQYDFFREWSSATVSTYLQFADAAAARQLGSQLDGLVDRHGHFRDSQVKPSDTLKLSLKPLDDLHFDHPGSRLTVVTLGVVGALTLLIAIVNYINLATARAGLRAREVAMRKVLGADQPALVRHFIGEAILTCAIGAFLGLVLAEIGLPLVNAAGGLDLRIAYFAHDGVVAPLALLVIVVGCLSGIYPALVLARFPAAAVLASARSPGGGRAGNRVREALVVFQFAIAIALMIGTSILVAQTRHVRTADLGFPRDGLLVIPSLASADLDDGTRSTLLHALAALPGVSGTTIGNGAPGYTDWDAETNVAIPGQPGRTLGFRQVTVGPDYFRVLGAHLLAGRVFDGAHPGDDSTTAAPSDATAVVINRTAVQGLGFASPQDVIGRTIGGKAAMVVVGVVDDLRFLSPRLALQPTRYELQTRQISEPIALVRFSGDPRATLQAAQDAWRRIAPHVPFEGRTAVQNLDRFYSADDHAARLFGFGAGLAVLIGCVGLWGLASFNTARRVKEIGIRKTLGASATDIIALLIGQFLRPVLIANVVAWPLAYVAMRTWLSGFSDPIGLSPVYFVGASGLATLIAVLTVLGQSLRASRAAPAWALRHE